MGPTVKIKKSEQEEAQTCDGSSKHRRSGPTVIDGGDGHVVLRLGYEAGQVQGGDVTADLHLQGNSGSSGTRLGSQCVTLNLQSVQSVSPTDGSRRFICEEPYLKLC